MDSFLLSFSVQAVTVEAFQAIAQNWSHPLLTDNAVISDLCDKERRYGGFTMFQKCQKHSQILHNTIQIQIFHQTEMAIFSNISHQTQKLSTPMKIIDDID